MYSKTLYKLFDKKCCAELAFNAIILLEQY